MLFSHFKIKDQFVLEDNLNYLKSADYKCIINKKILVNKNLQDVDFNIKNKIINLKKLKYQLWNRLKEIEYKNFNNFNYENIIVYNIQIIEINFNEEYVYYLNYKKMPKTQKLVLKLINNKLKNYINTFKAKFFIILNSIPSNLIFNDNTPDNSNIKTYYDKLKKWQNIKIDLINNFIIFNYIKSKYIKKNIKAYNYFLKILKNKNNSNKNYEINKNLISILDAKKLKKEKKINKIKENINNIIEENNELKDFNLIEYCNFKFKLKNDIFNLI